MKAKENNTEKLVKVPEKALLSLVANTLKDKVLFPEKVEKVKQYLKHVEYSK